MHDTKVAQEMGVEIWAAQEVLLAEIEVTPLAEPAQTKGKRGRPQTIQPAHLWVSWLWSVLLGMNSYADWWRLFCTQAVGGFAPIAVSADALTTRLEHGGLDPLQQLARSYSTRLPERLAPLLQTSLAAWASESVSIDESTLDAVQRWLEPRHRPKGDAALLAGKIAGRFNVRTQQWDYLQYREPGVGQLQSGSAQLAGRTGAGQADPLRFGLFQFRLVRLPDSNGLLVHLAAAREDHLPHPAHLLSS